MRTFGAPEGLGATPPPSLEIQPLNEWIIPDGEGMDLRHPVTLQPLHEAPSFLKDMGEVGEFWAAHADGMTIYGDVGPKGLKDNLARLSECPISFYGGNPVPHRRLLPKHTVTFNTFSGNNGNPLSEIVNKLKLMSVQMEINLLEQYSQPPKSEKSDGFGLAQVGAAIGMVSLIGVERWADAVHITDELRQIYRVKPELSKKHQNAYLHLDADQALVGATLGSLGAPRFQMGAHNNQLFADSMGLHATMMDVINTSRITTKQFATLALDGHLFSSAAHSTQ